MPSIQLVDNFTNATSDTVETVYTSPSDNSTIIETFTAANNSGVNASYKGYIVSQSGVLQPQRPFKIIVWGEIHSGAGLVNQVIPPGGSLRVESSAINSIYFTVTGKVLV